MIKGKAIYQPVGKAGEYAKYACNFYVGCSNGCSYCYLREGRGAAILGGDTPTLKKCFKDEVDAMRVFEKELKKNLPELQKHGLFLSFSTDPLLPETRNLTKAVISICRCQFPRVGVKILTKVASPVIDELVHTAKTFKENVAVGFSLSGRDELEPNASTNAERIEAMRKLHRAEFKTWASIEPIIDVRSSYNMIFDTAGFCDLYKIGLMDDKQYTKREIKWLIDGCYGLADIYKEYDFHIKFYFKDSLLKAAGVRREDLPPCCVTRDYDIFKR
jgi:DNA repair photolyase